MSSALIRKACLKRFKLTPAETVSMIADNGARYMATLQVMLRQQCKSPIRTNEELREYLMRHKLYEDEHLLVINKPPYVPVTGKYTNEPNVERALPMWVLQHRLDKVTTGVMLLARRGDSEVQKAIQKAFRNTSNGALCEVQKTYIALTEGAVNATRLHSWLRMTVKDHRMQSLKSRPIDGYYEEALTDIAVLSQVVRPKKYSVVIATPRTGRRHQIRAQLQSIDCPVLGDPVYGSALPFTFLHSLSLSLVHPVSKSLLTVSAPLPRFFLLTLQQLGFNDVNSQLQQKYKFQNK